MRQFLLCKYHAIHCSLTQARQTRFRGVCMLFNPLLSLLSLLKGRRLCLLQSSLYSQNGFVIMSGNGSTILTGLLTYPSSAPSVDWSGLPCTFHSKSPRPSARGMGEGGTFVYPPSSSEFWEEGLCFLTDSNVSQFPLPHQPYYSS